MQLGQQRWCGRCLQHRQKVGLRAGTSKYRRPWDTAAARGAWSWLPALWLPLLLGWRCGRGSDARPCRDAAGRGWLLCCAASPTMAAALQYQTLYLLALLLIRQWRTLRCSLALVDQRTLGMMLPGMVLGAAADCVGWRCTAGTQVAGPQGAAQHLRPRRAAISVHDGGCTGAESEWGLVLRSLPGAVGSKGGGVMALASGFSVKTGETHLLRHSG